jgi:opacity protein-like surface antigen
MQRISSGLLVLLTFCAVGTSSSAAAGDLLGVYAGAGVGQSHVRSGANPIDTALGFSEHHTAWKVVAGIRPISLVGAEFEYIDFGKTSASAQVAGNQLSADVHPKAVAVFGLLYMPIPLPVLDVYGKVGLARLQSTINAVGSCGNPCLVAPQYNSNNSNNRFAYGAGVQAKLLGLGVRVEYERINANAGDPDLFSLGVNWHF